MWAFSMRCGRWCPAAPHPCPWIACPPRAAQLLARSWGCAGVASSSQQAATIWTRSLAACSSCANPPTLGNPPRTGVPTSCTGALPKLCCLKLVAQFTGTQLLTPAHTREWELPLHGERVMYTTPRTHAGLSLSPHAFLGARSLVAAPQWRLLTSTGCDAGKLASVLVEAGARPVWMPTVRYMPLPEAGVGAPSESPGLASLDVALLELKSFDVVAFASRNALYGFLERMETLYGNVQSAVRVMSEARIKLACLPPVESLLREKLRSLADRIIPNVEGTEEWDHVIASTGSGAAVLCVAPVFDDFEEPKPLTQMMHKLTFSGRDVTRVPAYRVRAGDSDLFKQELEWLRRYCRASSHCALPGHHRFLTPLPCPGIRSNHDAAVKLM